MYHNICLKVWEVGRRIRDEEQGSELVEYGVLTAVVAVASIAVLGSLSGSINHAFQQAIDALPAVTP